MKNLSVIILTIVVVALLLCIAPALAFWAINTLFAYSIAFTFKNALAFYVLVVCVGGFSFRSK